MEMSSEKFETRLFLGQDSGRCKMVVDNKCLQVQNCKYLGCKISYENVQDDTKT